MIQQRIKNLYHLVQSLIPNIYYKFPSKKLKIIGITGTDGKTTTTSMIYHILKESGLKVAMISTISAKIGDTEIDTGLHVTTPEPWDLPRILNDFVQKGIEYVVIESTSSGLDQNRLFSINFDASTITNIGHDHIDYHKSWENYANAKFKLIEKTNKDGLVVLNKTHKSSEWLKNKLLMKKISTEVKWCSLSEVKNKEHSIDGIKFTLNNQNFSIPIIGEYNILNALQAISICVKYLELSKIAKALTTFVAPLGRMQVMQSRPFTIIVDFAHTPSSLENALKSVVQIKPNTNSRIISIFGCAGLRDKERRKMGGVSTTYSNYTIITLEDSRVEKVAQINDEIIEHALINQSILIKRFNSHYDYINTKLEDISIKQDSKPKIFAFDYDSVQNRIDAINLGISLAQPNDMVFITGKGHEKSLAIGDPIIEYEYTDQETVKNVINRTN